MIPTSRNYRNDLDDWFASAAAEAKARCAACGGRGVVFPNGYGAPSLRCSCMQQLNHELRFRRGNLPKMFWQPPGVPIKNRQVLEYSASLTDGEPGRGLLLVGPYGTGKTTHACWVLKNAAVSEKSIFRIEATEVERALSLIKSGQGWIDQWMQDGMFSDVVSIDELGAEATRGTCGREARSAISYYVKHRCEQSLSTVICTNLEQEEFIEHYGEAVSSIIFGSDYLCVPMQGEDLRR